MPVPLITNVMGSTSEELARLVEACDAREEIAAIELNVSCPNVATGLDIGADPAQLERVVRAREAPATGVKPLIVKLTPNTADVAAVAQAAQEAGADAVSLINTLRAMALAADAEEGVPRPPNSAGSGRHRRTVRRGDPDRRAGPGGRSRRTRERFPVVGMGRCRALTRMRVKSSFDERGRPLVAVGTETFRDPA